MYMADHIFPVLPIKDMVNKYDEPTTPFKLVTCTKPSVSHLCVLFCPCVLRKATAHVDRKSLNMHHQAQKFFAVSSLQFHSIKKGVLFTYRVQGR